jgi:WD40 repeat protein
MIVHSFAIAFLVVFPLWGALREQAHGGEGVAGAYGFGILGALLSLLIEFLASPSGVLVLSIFALLPALVLGLLASALFGFTLQVGRLIFRYFGRQPRYCQIAQSASRCVSVAAVATGVVGLAIPAADLFGLKPSSLHPSVVLRSWFSSRPVALAFDSKGQHLVSANWQDRGTDDMSRLIPGGQLTCYLLADGSVQAQTSLANWPNAVAYSPKEEQVAFGTSDGEVGLWDQKTGKVTLLGKQDGPVRKHDGPVEAVCYSPDGSRLVSGAGDSELILWDLRSHRPIRERRGGDRFTGPAIAWAPNGRLIAVGDEFGNVARSCRVTLLDAETLHDAQVFDCRHDKINSLGFSADGRYIVSGDGDNANGGQIIVWDVVKKTRRNEWMGPDPNKSVDFVGLVGASNDVVTAFYGDWRLQIWDQATKKPKTTCVGLAVRLSNRFALVR